MSENDCLSRTFLVTVKNHGRPHTRVSREICCVVDAPTKEGASFPCSLFRVFTVLQERWSPTALKTVGLERLLVRPQFNYEPFNSSSVNIRSWSWNYRGCWHQTCPPIVARFWMDLNIPHGISQTP